MDHVLFISVYYNRAYCVDESVLSMVNQTYKNVTALLWDDASTDDTYKKLLKYQSDKVLIRKSAQNQGLTKCLIQAIAESNAEFIAIHGSGDISAPERIEKQAQFLNENPEFGVCGCSITRRSEAFNAHSSRAYKPTGFVDPMQSPVMHGEVMFRRSLYNAVGGYRPFFVYSQDYDLWLRMREHGTRFGGLGDALYSCVSRRDGVTGDCIKCYFQACYAGIAFQAHLDRMRGGIDIVEQYGTNALLLLKPNKLYAGKMVGVCMLSIFNDNMTFAKRAARESLKTRIRLKVLVTWVLLCFTGNWGMQVVKKLYQARLGADASPRTSSRTQEPNI